MTISITPTTGTGSGLITSTGVGSGLDINTIVTQLVTAEGQAQTNQLNAQQSDLQTKLSAYGSFQSAAASLSTALQPLMTQASFSGRTVSTSDSTVSVTATSAAATGTYNVQVQQLASAQSLISTALGSTVAVGTGTLTIKVGSQTLSLNIDSSNNTLAGIAAAINSAAGNPGVSATVINGSSGAQLMLAADSTGAANAITVTQSGGDGGLAALTYDPANSVTQLSQLTAAADAKITFDGVTATSSTNTFNSVISGLQITANAVSGSGTSGATTSTQVVVADDVSGARAKINAFVTSYNTLVTTLQGMATYDPTTQIAGPLLGDPTYQNFMGAVNQTLSTRATSLNLPFSTLADLGITRQANGTLAVNTTTLTNALNSNFDGVMKLFTDPTHGVASQLNTVLQGYASATGALHGVMQGIQQGLTGIATQQTALKQRLAAYQTSLLAQFNAMDSLVAQMKSTQSFLTQQLASLPTMSSLISATSSTSTG
ncbi:MAG TPA: flagellar filament capping protein FliD [Steroidobacteraceae bacterium]|nr:flagellar filament capping protein FliD [Steroidobacteraceae bacterium]